MLKAKEKEIAKVLQENYGVPKRVISMLMVQCGYMIKESDTIEFAAAKIYNNHIGNDIVVMGKSVLLEGMMIAVDMILQRALQLTQTHHGHANTQAQSGLMYMRTKIRDIVENSKAVFGEEQDEN